MKLLLFICLCRRYHHQRGYNWVKDVLHPGGNRGCYHGQRGGDLLLQMFALSNTQNSSSIITFHLVSDRRYCDILPFSTM